VYLPECLQPPTSDSNDVYGPLRSHQDRLLSTAAFSIFRDGTPPPSLPYPRTATASGDYTDSAISGNDEVSLEDPFAEALAGDFRIYRDASEGG
jgi:hypothetical protein